MQQQEVSLQKAQNILEASPALESNRVKVMSYVVLYILHNL